MACSSCCLVVLGHLFGCDRVFVNLLVSYLFNLVYYTVLRFVNLFYFLYFFIFKQFKLTSALDCWQSGRVDLKTLYLAKLDEFFMVAVQKYKRYVRMLLWFAFFYVLAFILSA